MKGLFKSMQPDSELHEMKSIGLSKPVNGQAIYREGDLVAIENGKLIEATHATHRIIGLYGTIDFSRLELTVIDVITNEPSVFKIK